MSAIRLRYSVLGGHVHCRVFTAPSRSHTFAKNGDLVFSVDEWSSVQTQLEMGGVECIDDKREPA